VELMDADDWCKIVEKKLQVVQCNNCEKMLLPLTDFLVLQLTGGMLTWKSMRNPRASTGQSLYLLFMHIMFSKELSS
jgi:hypothetical protein